MTRIFKATAAALLFTCLGAASAFAQTGRIAGSVVDAATGESLPGVNVVIQGTTQGTTTNAEGYYTILNVSPGTYDVRASFIGYAPQVVQGVRVNIGLTSEIDFELREQVFEGEEVVVTAEQEVIQQDVSASLANISAEQVEELPVTSVTGAVGLQAGIEGGLSIRGGQSDEVSYMVNGLTLRDERNNSPFTGVPISSVQEIQVQTGGFNAEYGNVRSGLINVVTKEGSAEAYEGEVVMRYSPPADKHFGPQPNDPGSFWIRPFVDPDVAWTGTENGAWDEHTQAQYPEFRGWVAVSEDLLSDDDPANDMTPEALQQAFMWQRRKTFEITRPDYTMDLGFGGPVPALRSLGRTRFYASYRRTENAYLYPLATDRYLEQTGHLKVTSNIGRGMKLTVEGLLGEQDGTSGSTSGQPSIVSSAYSVANLNDRVSYIDARIFSDAYYSPTHVQTFMLGTQFTHTLSDRAFYELRLTRFASDYTTGPAPFRDTTSVVEIGGVGFDAFPFGYAGSPVSRPLGNTQQLGWGTARDSSLVATWNAKGDLTAQLNRFLQVKTGLEFNLTESHVDYARFNPYLQESNQRSEWDRYPMRAAGYFQGKLEFQGMIANAGLRLDYSDPRGDWYDYGRFALTADLTELEQVDTESQLTLSPRLGVSFPVTEFSKLYFNYGHFRSMPDPDDLFLVRFAGPNFANIGRIANPNSPLPRTVAYELGYEHALFEQFRIRAAGYYKDVSNENNLVEYVARDGTIYTRSEPTSYQDVRGFELTLSREAGKWLQGFVNYTYMVNSYGYFGVDEFFQNPTQQREYLQDEAERRAALTEPVPRPYGRLVLNARSPLDFGPAAGGVHPLGGWLVSLLGSWRDGGKITWAGGGGAPAGVRNNVDVVDYWDWDLRFKRNIDVAGTRVQFFLDVYNLFNQQRFSSTGFYDGNDYNDYVSSLHLPDSPVYSATNIPGDDAYGTYRDPDVAYQPMQRVASRQQFQDRNPDPAVIYYESSSESFIVYRDGAWEPVDQGRLDEVLDSRAYIDMPNLTYQTFLNPRDIYLGFSFRF